MAVSAGTNHTCALTSDREVKCWGANEEGELGDGTTTFRSTPVDVFGLGPGSGVVALAAGGYHTCALTSEGKVKCWGNNQRGQLGDGHFRPIPGDVIGFGGNSAPVAQSQSVTTNVGAPVGIALPATDPNNDPLTYSIVAGPTHGTLSGATPNVTYTPNAGYVGSDSFTYKANDGTADSNVATVTVSIKYAFTGIYQTATAGASVPIKFSLGGNQGLSIFATGYPVAQQVVCGSAAPTGAVQATISASTPPLSYDAPSTLYNYVWKTDRSWAGTCRQFTLRLIDGSDHTELFLFK